MRQWLRLKLFILAMRLYLHIRVMDINILFLVYQKSADQIQKHLGINCFLLSNIVFIMSFTFDAARYFFQIGRMTGLAALALALIYIPTYIGNQFIVRRLKPGYVNPLLESAWLQRVLLVFLLGWCNVILWAINPHMKPMARICSFADYACYISAIYWLACTPRPPRKSTVRKLLEKLSPSPAMEPALQEG